MLDRRTLTLSSLALPLLYAELRSSRGFAQVGAVEDDAGVASGNPTADSVVLWTRVPAAAQTAGHLGDGISVRYEVATSETFEPASVVVRGETATGAACDYTVKVLATGLAAFTTYYYRFQTASGYASVVGRTKTAPAPGVTPPSLKFALVSCQNFSEGYYAAYLHLAREAVDYCIHLGDHIYEHDDLKGRRGAVDPLDGAAAQTLDDYRRKHRQYLSDPAWREARRLFAWVDLWDDHEVYNDYSGAADMPKDPARFRGGYQAFLEYMPIMGEIVVDPAGRPQVTLQRSQAFGDLVELFVLDERQYRMANPCGGSSYFARGCEAMRAPEHSMLGTPQRDWLKESLGASRATWKLVLNEVVMAPMRLPAFGAEPTFGATAERRGSTYVDLDAWDGFPSERHEILRFIEEHAVANVVVCSGDIHAALNATLYSDPLRHSGPAAAVEIVTTSISSKTIYERVGAVVGGTLEAVVHANNKHLVWADLRSHGYAVLTVTAEGIDVRHMKVDSVKHPTSPLRLARRSQIPAGSSRFLS